MDQRVEKYYDVKSDIKKAIRDNKKQEDKKWVVFDAVRTTLNYFEIKKKDFS